MDSKKTSSGSQPSHHQKGLTTEVPSSNQEVVRYL